MRTIALFALAAIAFAKKHHHGGESHHVAHHRHHHGEHHVAHHRAHHGEGAHHIHHGEHAHKIRRHHAKRPFKHGATIVQATKEHGNIVNRGAWSFFKKVATISGEDSHSKKFKNPLSRRARRHARKIHGGENGRRVHGGEHKQRRNRRRNHKKNKKVAKMNTKMVKVTEEPAKLALFKKVATVAGEDSHSHKKFKNPLSKRARRHMRKIHGGESTRKHRVHNGEHKQRRNHKKNKKVAKMTTTMTKIADEKKPAALGLYELSQALNLNQF